MKKKGIFMTLVLAVLMVFTMGLSACGDNRPVIAVIAKGESHAFWQSVKRGAVAAGDKYGYRVTFRGPDSETASDLGKQIEMVSAALSSKPKGMALATIGTGFTDLLKQMKAENIPVVQFDSGIYQGKDLEGLTAAENPVVASVSTSNRLAGKLAAETFYELLKEDIIAATTDNPYIVGVIQHDRTSTGDDRAGGFVERFEELVAANEQTAGKVKKINQNDLWQIRDGDADKAYAAALQALKVKNVNAVYMCNEGVVKQVFDEVFGSSQYDAIKFFGFDAGTKQIEWMRKTTGPKLLGAVAQDSYNIGYKTVEQVVKAIKGEQVTEKVEIAGKVWNASNVDKMIEDGYVYEG